KEIVCLRCGKHVRRSFPLDFDSRSTSLAIVYSTTSRLGKIKTPKQIHRYSVELKRTTAQSNRLRGVEEVRNAMLALSSAHYNHRSIEPFGGDPCPNTD